MSQWDSEQVRRWHQRLFRTALRLTGDPDQAADFAQETLCKGMSRWDQFDRRSKVSTWLHRILINTVRDHHRRLKHRRHEPFDTWAVRVVSDEAGPQTRAIRAETRRRLIAGIEQLPEDQRRALLLTVIDGHSYRTAAELLGVPIGTVGSRVYQARQHLLGLLQGPRQGTAGATRKVDP